MKQKIMKKKLSIMDVLKSKHFRIAVLSITLLIIFSQYKKRAIYVTFLILNGIIIYYSKLYHFPIDVSPLFFLEIVITRYYGLEWTLLFILLSYIVPKTLAGSSMNWMSYIFISIGLIPVVISMFFKNVPLVYLGYASSVIQYIGGVLFQSTMRPMLLCLGDGVANVLNNIIWFLLFSDVIVWILA